MATLTQQEAPSEAFRQARASLKVSAYERVSSLLIALLVLVGVAVFFLLMAWLSNRVIIRQRALPLVLEETGGGVETGFGTEGMEIDAPQVSDVAQAGAEAPSKFAEAVTEVVTTVTTAGVGEQPELLDMEQTVKGGSSRGTGDRPARGSGGGSGGGSGVGVGAPRAQRWEIQFQDEDSLASYARQLDFFGIELGVVGTSTQVIYVTNLSKPVPDRREGPRDKEIRLYMSWQKGALQQADRELVKRAGVATADRVVLQFYPADVEKRLAGLEKQFKGKDAKDIRRTRFGVKSVGKAEYTFHVIDQSTF